MYIHKVEVSQEGHKIWIINQVNAILTTTILYHSKKLPMSIFKLGIAIHVYSLVKPNHHSGELLSMLTRAEKKLLVE